MMFQNFQNFTSNPLYNAIKEVTKNLLQYLINSGKISNQHANIIYNSVMEYLNQIVNNISTQYPNGINESQLQEYMKYIIEEIYKEISTSSGFQQPINYQNQLNTNLGYFSNMSNNQYNSSFQFQSNIPQSNPINDPFSKYDTINKENTNINTKPFQYVTNSVKNNVINKIKTKDSFSKDEKNQDMFQKPTIISNNDYESEMIIKDIEILKPINPNDNIKIVEKDIPICIDNENEIFNIHLKEFKLLEYLVNNNIQYKYNLIKFDYKNTMIWNKNKIEYDLFNLFNIISDEQLLSCLDVANQSKCKGKKFIKYINGNYIIPIQKEFFEILNNITVTKENNNDYIININELIESNIKESNIDKYLIDFINYQLEINRPLTNNKLNYKVKITSITDIPDLINDLKNEGFTSYLNKIFSNLYKIIKFPEDNSIKNDDIKMFRIPFIIILSDQKINFKSKTIIYHPIKCIDVLVEKTIRENNPLYLSVIDDMYKYDIGIVVSDENDNNLYIYYQ